jgi:hypothetical protein
VFGVGRLPEVGGAIGKGIREFRNAAKDEDTKPPTDASASVAESHPEAATTAEPATTDDAVFCGECGTRNASTAKFCASCGTAIAAPVS